MTEGQVQGKWVLVRNNGEFEVTEFELAGSYCIARHSYHCSAFNNITFYGACITKKRDI